MFTDLFKIISTNGLSVPSEVAAVFRAIGTLEGTLTLVQPDFNMIGGARAFASDYLGEQMRPSALQKTLTDELTSLLPMLRRLPRRIDRIVGALEEGRLSVNVRAFAHEDDRNGVSGLVHEVLITVLASTSGIMAVLLLGLDGEPKLTDSVSLFQFSATSCWYSPSCSPCASSSSSSAPAADHQNSIATLVVAKSTRHRNPHRHPDEGRISFPPTTVDVDLCVDHPSGIAIHPVILTKEGSRSRGRAMGTGCPPTDVTFSSISRYLLVMITHRLAAP